MPHSKFNPWNKVYLVRYLNCWGDNPGYVIADDGRMVEVMAVEWNASEDSWFYILANEDRSEIYSAYERSDVVCRDYPEARDRAAELNRMIRERDAGGIRCECCHRWHWMTPMTLPEDYAAYRKSAGWTERDGKWSCPDCINKEEADGDIR